MTELQELQKSINALEAAVLKKCEENVGLRRALLPFTWPGKDMGDAAEDDQTPFVGTVTCGDVMRARKAAGETK